MRSKREAKPESDCSVVDEHALAPGELDTSDGSFFKWFTAAGFLAVVLRGFPGVRGELETCPVPRPDADSFEDVDPFREWIRRWARANRIDSVPLMIVAGQSVLYWNETGRCGPIRVHLRLDFEVPSIENPPLPPFNPISETKAAWLRRVGDWTERVLEEYRAHGYRKAKRKNEPSHYHWLARRTVGGETVSQIALDVKRRERKSDASEPGEYRQRVDDAVRRLALAIDLPLR